jgi:2-C-methyl-D-erythritol 4-phosphate cytidylyltransferase
VNPIAFQAVVPAAGAGARMGAPVPKTYLPLAGRTVIEWALAPLLAHTGLQRLVVALAPDDTRFAQLAVAADPRIETVIGGASRAASVAAGLDALGAAADGPVLVHDGARPCLSVEEIERLITCAGDPAGALLAVPVRDTLKRADANGRVAATEDRSGLWQALTPQLFHGGRLREALGDATDPGVTDEASAMERAGHAPRLVEGDPANIKITRPHDLPLAEAVLAMRGGQ